MRMREEGGVDAPAQRLELGLPGRVTVILIDVPEDLADHQREELLLAREVRVEGHRRHPHLAGDGSNGQCFGADVIEDGQSRKDHRLASDAASLSLAPGHGHGETLAGTRQLRDPFGKSRASARPEAGGTRW